MKKKIQALLYAALGVMVTQPSLATEVSPGPFQIVSVYALPGDEKWDYLALDMRRHHLFVSRSHHVQVLDTETGAVVGDIPHTEGVHGIAIDQEDGLGYTSNGKADSVTVFNLDSLKTVDTVKTSGADPDAILYIPELKQVYAFNGHGHNISVFSAPSHRLIHTIDIGATPEFGASDHHGHVFFNIEDKSEIGVIDTNTGVIMYRWSLPNCPGPTGLALDETTHRLFSSCQNHQLSVTDASTGQHISDMPIGEHPDGVVFDANTREILVSNGGGSLTVIQQRSANHYRVLQNLRTRKSAKTMVYDPGSQRVFMLGAALTPESSSQAMPPLDAAQTHLASLLVLAPKN